MGNIGTKCQPFFLRNYTKPNAQIYRVSIHVLKHPHTFQPPGFLSWDDFRERASLKGSRQEAAQHAAGVSATDPYNIQYTSGTTGRPKPALLSQHNVLNNGYLIGSGCRLGPDDRVCIPVPLFHCFGAVLGNMATLTHGGTIVYPAGEGADVSEFGMRLASSCARACLCSFHPSLCISTPARLHSSQNRTAQWRRCRPSSRSGAPRSSECPPCLSENWSSKSMLG